MYAFRDQNGKILALCIHFRVQSGDSGYMARESCRQGPFLRRGPGNHAWREDVANAARPFAVPRRGSRARELAERALRPAARAWSACRMRGSLPSRQPRRHSRPPCPLRREPGDITRHVVHRSRGGEPLIGRPRRPVVIRARARRLRFPLPGPTTCASRCPLQPRATRVPRPSRTLRGLRHLRPPSASRTAANERNCAASSMRA